MYNYMCIDPAHAGGDNSVRSLLESEHDRSVLRQLDQPHRLALLFVLLDVDQEHQRSQLGAARHNQQRQYRSTDDDDDHHHYDDIHNRQQYNTLAKHVTCHKQLAACSLEFALNGRSAELLRLRVSQLWLQILQRQSAKYANTSSIFCINLFFMKLKQQ